jgi:hypothetical protein
MRRTAVRLMCEGTGADSPTAAPPKAGGRLAKKIFAIQKTKPIKKAPNFLEVEGFFIYLAIRLRHFWLV